uniref:Uncharacterized protein n=1 Tax=Tanacetum cinerariifolium TaxID=118510 RepID=A0A699JN71_TANCI|nr:hypothetical protein [Tanacetum cinerariifolium]
MASNGSDQSVRYILSKLLQRGTVAKYEKKIDIVLSLPSEEAPPVIKGSLDANEDIGVVELWERIGIDDAHGLIDNGRNHKFVQPNVWGWMSDSQSAYSSYHLEGKVIFEGVRSVTAWVAEGERMVLCYVEGSGRRKRKKFVGCGSGRQENYGSGRRDCGRIMI